MKNAQEKNYKREAMKLPDAASATPTTAYTRLDTRFLPNALFGITTLRSVFLKRCVSYILNACFPAGVSLNSFRSENSSFGI
mmetsp:Transcript_5732/g.8449  ORF Transcript_5732/g.8449 Transcript_5732/m.8449 type:complete len:82 (-) Transcript_5732:563-808(-)